MSTYGEQKKAWAKQWAKLRRDYLSGRLADAIVLPAEGGYRWDCPFCGRHGSTVTSEALATTAGRGHMQQHVSDNDDEALEDLKVTRMPESP
ncbi:hypothetical protein [Acidipropionibacterium timonense]|uniref:hypothetical protein n=1 Tax=Acidipropionibacterium timonense TaxID=2161818 RepID=UPI001032598B|nr:hypothetical protein [Acidipropionibacterium timonense]